MLARSILKRTALSPTAVHVRPLSIAVSNTSSLLSSPLTADQATDAQHKAAVARKVALARDALSAARDALGDCHPRTLAAGRDLVKLLSSMGTEHAEEAATMTSQMRLMAQGLYPR